MMKNNTTIDDYVISDGHTEKTAKVHLINSIGKSIDLVSVSHIGNPRYYREIKKILKKCDVVLYERGKDNPIKKGFRDNLIFRNSLNVRKFYRDLAQAVSDFQIEAILESSGIADIGLEDNVEENMKKEFKRFRVIYQGDSIDYENLPKNWHHADLTGKEFDSCTSIFSKTNLSFGLINLLCYFKQKNKHFFYPMARKITEKGFKYTDLNNPSSKTERMREGKIYELIDTFGSKDGIKRIGIIYGALHAPFIEARLNEKGYIRESITYLTYFNKIQCHLNISKI